jgi:hypothetical protein
MSLSTRNPLDEIKDELKRVLADAQDPFTEDQERSIALVLEESRRASEDLFGEAMDFRSGPPQGERLDRARAGIQWMNEDFSKRARQFLTANQLAAWDKHLAEKSTGKTAAEGQTGTAGTKEQVQQIRINNNPFTAENQFFGSPSGGGSFGFASGGGVTSEIFQRGGAGAFHGTMSFNFKDESLNARNPFAGNKPAYQQRNVNFTTSGPLIPRRLTVSFTANQTEQENVDTIHAHTPEGPFELGITRPAVSRYSNAGGTYQIRDDQSLIFSMGYNMFRNKNQGIGGFNLPERALTVTGDGKWVDIRHVWFASSRLVQDIRWNAETYDQEIAPLTDAATVDVLGHFGGGGSSERSRRRDSTHLLRTLWIYTGRRWSARWGVQVYQDGGIHNNENNYQGAFTFSDLQSFLASTPITYKVVRGEPQLRLKQTDWAGLIQNDLRISDRLTLFFGVRYEGQTNLGDRNNFDPRVAVAYAIGNSTVIRVGAGIFHTRVGVSVSREVLRLDGARQQEIVLINPSYPDPFQAFDQLLILPPASRRTRAASLVAPYLFNVAFSIERSLPKNLFVSASYDHDRGVHQLRSRDLNAPLPGTPAVEGKIPRPDPLQGNVWQLESTGLSTWDAFRVNMRQRFSIFSVTGSYTFQLTGNDFDGTFSAPSNSHDLRSDWARTKRHQFNVSLNSRLPLGVFITTNVVANSGNPYTVITGRDDNGDGVPNDRPAAESRYSRYGPAYRDISFNISKAFSLGKAAAGSSASTNLNLYANLYNALNSTHLGTPIGILTSNSFGKSINAFSPREIQVGIRLQF